MTDEQWVQNLRRAGWLLAADRLEKLAKVLEAAKGAAASLKMNTRTRIDVAEDLAAAVRAAEKE